MQEQINNSRAPAIPYQRQHWSCHGRNPNPTEGKQRGPSLGDRMPSGGRAQKQLCPKTGLTASGRGAGTKQHPRGSTSTPHTPFTGGNWVSGGKYRFHDSTCYRTRLYWKHLAQLTWCCCRRAWGGGSSGWLFPPPRVSISIKWPQIFSFFFF